MRRLSDEGKRKDHPDSQLGRRDFLKTSAATGAAAGLGLFATRPATAHDDDDVPEDSGRRGRRYIIRGGAVISIDPQVGDFPKADVLVEGKKILAVGANLHAGDADEIDARGKIVMPGFIDTHHHQFETALRSFLADGVLINDGSGSPSGRTTYFEFILLQFAPVYRPQDVYINELFGGLSQLDGGVTTVHDVSQIHHSPQHSDAAIQALFDTGRRAAFGYFEGAGTNPPNYAYPQDAIRIKKKWFSSSDQLVHMIMGGEVYLGDPTTDLSWTIGRHLDLQIAAHILSPFGIRPIFDKLAAGTGGNGAIGIGPDNLFIHMTGMADPAWQKVKDVGAQVSIAFPIEMNMRHGIPPIIKMQQLGMEPSLSVDVECTLTADFFTQMRVCMNMQRMVVNQMILGQGDFYPPNQWPTPAAGTPPLLTTRDVLRYGTMNGAKALRLENKAGSLTPGKEADILILDAEAINVVPLNNVAGAVVSLMDRTNVETVIVAGKVRKWKGKLLDVDLPNLRRQLENSRDYIFAAAKIPQNLFGSQ
ncbi:MAG TPA: amidohydrolase family protein [Candidatus Methylomirabilis sp.]|nr:amidohydrolase family protein [Candidatus Methylomirabilis sp.]